MTDFQCSREVAPEQWDAFIEAQDASPYLRYAWGQAVTRAYGHPCHYFACYDQSNRIRAVLPVAEFRRPILGNQFISLPYCDLGGPVADSSEAEAALNDFVQSWCQRQHLPLAIRRGGEKLQNTDDQRPQKVSMKLTLPDSREQLLNSFKSKLRSQIRKAEKNGLSAKVLTQPQGDDIDQFYQVIALNMRSLGSPVHSKRWFQSVVEHYQGQLCLGLVKYQDKVVGAGLVLKNGRQAAIPWASTIAQYNRLAPNMLLYWSLLGHCADDGIQCFDFGRSTLNEGTYKFKKQWGAEPYRLHWYDTARAEKENDSAQSISSGALKNTIINLWSSLPIAITNSVGPRIRRYISL